MYEHPYVDSGTCTRTHTHTHTHTYAHSFSFYHSDLYANRLNPSGDVPELSGLVGKILHVFEPVSAEPLKEKWAKIALQVRTINIFVHSHPN